MQNILTNLRLKNYSNTIVIIKNSFAYQETKV